MTTLTPPKVQPRIQDNLDIARGYRFFHIDTIDVIVFCPDGTDGFIYYGVESAKENSSNGDSLLYVRDSYEKQRKEDSWDAKLLEEAQFFLRTRRGNIPAPIEMYFLERGDETYFPALLEPIDSNLEVYLTGKMSRKKIRNIGPWFGCLIGVTSFIHELGIQHGAINPSGIRVKSGRILLPDFGIQKGHLENRMPTSGFRGYYAPEVENGNAPSQSADIFSLGAVFLEMVIAHSHSGREKLESILTAQGSRSYAAAIDQLGQFISTLEQTFQLDSWYLTVLSYCRMMLRVEPDQRPLAEELRLAWLSLSSDLPPCTCPKLHTLGMGRVQKGF